MKGEDFMKIYTSYYANLKNIPEDIIPISIAGKCPDFYEGLQYKKLAPKYWFFQQWKINHDNDFYIENFNKEVLNTLTPKKVVEDLMFLSEGKDVVLLCYEKLGDFCHRHLVANWLNDNGIDCEEFIKGD